MMFRDLTLLGKVAVILIAAVCLFALVAYVGWQMGAGARTRANQAGASQIAAEARATSGGDAVNTVAKNAASEADIDQQSQENRDAILKAPGADVRVDPSAAAAGRRAWCMRASTRGDPACQRLLDPGSR